MTRKEYRNQLLKRCGKCARDSPWCSVVLDTDPEPRRHWDCNIEQDWRWFLTLGMPPEELLKRVGLAEDA